MKCPKCNAELSIYVLHDDYDTFCSHCGYFPKKKSLYPAVEAKYCPKVQNGDLSEAEFEEYFCDDCVYDDCILARSVSDDLGLVQDSEGNWVEADELDELERADLDLDDWDDDSEDFDDDLEDSEERDF